MAAELGMMGLGLFTGMNLPAEWLLGAAVPLLALLVHKDGNKENDAEATQAEKPPHPT